MVFIIMKYAYGRKYAQMLTTSEPIRVGRIKPMLRSIVLLFWFLAGIGHGAGAATVLSTDQTRIPLPASAVAVLRDSGATLTVEALTRAPLEAGFATMERITSLGYTKDVTWLRINLQRQADAPSTWYLEITNPYINDLRLYTRSAGGYQVAQAGDQFPFAERALQFHHPVFALNFPDTGVQSFYLRMDSDSSLSAEFLLWQPQALRSATERELLLFGAVGGMLLMSLLISLIHWHNSREARLLQFAALTVCIFFLAATGLGLFAQFLTPTLPRIADLMVPATIALTAVFVGVVFGNALGIGHGFARVQTLLRCIAGLALLAPFTRAIGMYSSLGGPLLQFLFLATLVTTGWISWRRWQTGMQGAGYFFAAHLVLIGSVLLGRLTLLGLLPTNAMTYMGWMPGMLTFIFLVHAGIFVDSRSGRRARDAAVQSANTANEVLARERSLREEQSTFFSFVAHELRSPLGAVVTGVKNLENDLAQAPPRALARMQRIRGAAERMGHLIERHLHLQRLSAADFAPRLAAADPVLPAQESVRRARAVFADRVFDLHCAADLPPWVALDLALLPMCLENLLLNAAKYSPAGAAVQMEVFADTALHYRILDRGPGIPLEQREHIFSLFGRASLAPPGAGFGIGLAIARHVARVHRGSLEYSEREGGGAVFTLTLPLNLQAPTDHPCLPS